MADVAVPSIIAHVVDVSPCAHTDVFVIGSRRMPVTALDQRARSVLRVPEPSVREMVRISRSRFDSTRRGLFKSGFGHHGLLSWLLQLQSTWTCLREIETAEQALAFRYSFVVRVRLDSRWFSPIPPLAWQLVASGLHAAVVPDEDHCGGLNDRFVLASRAAFTSYASLYLQCGAAWQPELAPKNRSVRPRLKYANAEIHLMRQLQHHNHTFAELPMPFCLVSRGFNRSQGSCPRCKKHNEGLRALLARRRAASALDFEENERCCLDAAPQTWHHRSWHHPIRQNVRFEPLATADTSAYHDSTRRNIDPRICGLGEGRQHHAFGDTSSSRHGHERGAAVPAPSVSIPAPPADLATLAKEALQQALASARQVRRCVDQTAHRVSACLGPFIQAGLSSPPHASPTLRAEIGTALARPRTCRAKCKRPAYVHIPKVGGEALERALGLRKSHHSARQRGLVRGDAVVAVIRNPFARQLSWFQFCCHGYHGSTPWPPLLCNVATDLVQHALERKQLTGLRAAAWALERWLLFAFSPLNRKWAAAPPNYTLTVNPPRPYPAGVCVKPGGCELWTGWDTFYFARAPYTWWLLDDAGHLAPRWLLRLENYSQDWERVSHCALGCSGTVLRHLNPGGSATSGARPPGSTAHAAALLMRHPDVVGAAESSMPWRHFYSATARSLVEFAFEDDLQLFGYTW